MEKGRKNGRQNDRKKEKLVRSRILLKEKNKEMKNHNEPDEYI